MTTYHENPQAYESAQDGLKKYLQRNIEGMQKRLGPDAHGFREAQDRLPQARNCLDSLEKGDFIPAILYIEADIANFTARQQERIDTMEDPS